MLASEAIKAYLETTRYAGNSDLIDRLIEHGTSLELQVNVAPGSGEPVHGKRNTYTDGINQWFSFRVPKGAYTDDAYWKDFNMRFNLLEHIDSIGSTGWDWENKQSLWVGFDFDTISGHAEGVGISDVDLDRVRDAACKLPYLEVRRSTGGNGLHLYAHVDKVPTSNHNEHAALARVILLKMSEDVGFNLADKVDVCGSNMWVAAKRANMDTSFALIKAHEQFFLDIPEDWKNNIDVVRRRRARVSIPGLDSSEDSMFERLTSAHRRVELDPMHLSIREELANRGCCVWVQDHHLLQTHTVLLEQLHGASCDLDLKGVFKTNSPGSNTTEPNCFMHPLENGSWKIYRFGPGTAEDNSWEQDGRGWTSCMFNAPPKLDQAASVGGGVKTKKGNFEFAKLRDAIKMIKQISKDENFDIEASSGMLDRKAIVGRSPSGEIFLEVQKQEGDAPAGNWNSSDRKGYHTALVGVHAEPEVVNPLDYDNTIRCLKTPDCNQAGWASKSSQGSWDRQPTGNVKMILQSLGHPKSEAECIMGVSVQQAWQLVNVPFADEYPGNRRWNLNSPQLSYEPVPYDEGGLESPHPHWDMILTHIGQGLDKYLRRDKWAVENSVISGQQYLEHWFASVIQCPYDPLPYLFLYGPENSGKSVLHEAFSLLVTRGVVFADRALTSTNDFNGELEGCILAVVEEKNVTKASGAHARIKQYVTAEELSIRRMRTDSYEVANTTHWVQMSNEPDACPVFAGDTRIVALHVPPVKSEIPKQRLLAKLREEAGFFTHTLLSSRIPTTTGRLRIPVVNTEFKQQASNMNKDQLQVFLETEFLPDPVGEILFKDLYASFGAWLPQGVERWSKRKLTARLTMLEDILLKTGSGNKLFVTGIKPRVLEN